jgi:hypothetical protein
MKAAILLPILIVAGCASYPTRNALEPISNKLRPEQAQLEPSYNSYVQRAFSENTEYGIINILDGSKVYYWFRSHHLMDDMGGTLFEFPDHKIYYMAGWFCCEAQFPDVPFKNLSELKEFILNHHGISP